LENKIEYIKSSIDNTNDSISKLDERIAITKTQIKLETSEFKKANLLSNLNVYSKHGEELDASIS
jgi:hypothetical protein